MTTVIQTQAKSTRIGALKDIYTQLGQPTVSLFAEAYQDIDDGMPLNRPLAFDGLDLVAVSSVRTDILMSKVGNRNYLKFNGTSTISTVNKKAFNTDNNLTIVMNIKMISGNGAFGWGANATANYVGFGAVGAGLRVIVGYVGNFALYRKITEGFIEGIFNKVAVHFNKEKTIIVCNGVVTEIPAVAVNFTNSYEIHRGSLEYDLDFLQVFENTNTYSGDTLAGYLDYISES